MKFLDSLRLKNKEDFFHVILQFIKFGMVGISNTLISLSIYYILNFLKINYILSYTIAFFISVINAYYWNNKYVFKKSGNQQLFRFLKVFISYGLTFLLSTGLLILMVDELSISDKIAPLIILIITIPLNFLLNKFWAFKSREGS